MGYFPTIRLVRNWNHWCIRWNRELDNLASVSGQTTRYWKIHFVDGSKFELVVTPRIVYNDFTFIRNFTTIFQQRSFNSILNGIEKWCCADTISITTSQLNLPFDAMGCCQYVSFSNEGGTTVESPFLAQRSDPGKLVKFGDVTTDNSLFSVNLATRCKWIIWTSIESESQLFVGLCEFPMLEYCQLCNYRLII